MMLKALFMVATLGMASGGTAEAFSQTPVPAPIENFSRHTPQNTQLVNHWCHHHPWRCHHYGPYSLPVPHHERDKILQKEARHCRIIPILLNAENFVLTTGTFAIPDNNTTWS